MTRLHIVTAVSAIFFLSIFLLYINYSVVEEDPSGLLIEIKEEERASKEKELVDFYNSTKKSTTTEGSDLIIAPKPTNLVPREGGIQARFGEPTPYVNENIKGDD